MANRNDETVALGKRNPARAAPRSEPFGKTAPAGPAPEDDLASTSFLKPDDPAPARQVTVRDSGGATAPPSDAGRRGRGSDATTGALPRTTT